ncbi:trichodiene oxygenase [Hypoxylon sp. FL1857]|nr:trichodiene oxygenase [Hypoxylon sp. FL1857]
MEFSIISLSWKHITATIVLYFVSLAVYRLFWHPLARFPGPKLAAVTRYVEAYYDLILNGQYTFKIAEMHEKYGPIIRISPHELHVNDPSFFETLYSRDGRWDKYDWSYDAFGAELSTICALDHYVHRRRRAPLGTFMSKGNVSNRQEIVSRLVSKLCDRLDAFAESNRGADPARLKLSPAISSFTRDVATEFLFGESHNNLDHPDFNPGLTTVLQASGSIWRISKHIRWYGRVMKSLPLSLVEKLSDDNGKAFLVFLKDMIRLVTDIHSASANKTLSADSPHTLVNEILESDLPPSDKSFERCFDEAITVSSAAFETTAHCIRVILYHVYRDEYILRRLRDELAASSARSPTQNLRLAELEQLPYLTAVLMEGLRLAPAVATRQARVAPDRDLIYKSWIIPAGTPVGMTTILMHRNPELYPNPEQFNPERWVDINERRKAEKTFAPFSRGARICVGMHLAWAELYMALAGIIPRYDLSFDDAAYDDIKWSSDQFIIGTSGKGGLPTTVKKVEA